MNAVFSYQGEDHFAEIVVGEKKGVFGSYPVRRRFRRVLTPKMGELPRARAHERHLDRFSKQTKELEENGLVLLPARLPLEVANGLAQSRELI